MNIKEVIVGLFCASLISCSGYVPKLVPTSPTILVTQPDSALIKWNLATDFSTNFWDESVDSMIFIPLETNEYSLLGGISQIQKIGDKLLLVDTDKAQKILVFDMQGKYLYNIGKKGEGPGEYTSIHQVKITPEGICVLDGMAWKYLCFDINGNLLYEHQFGKRIPSSLIRLANHTFIGSHAGYYEESPYHLTWIDDKDSLLNTALPIRNLHAAPAGNLQYTFDGTLLFYHNLCDTIYQILDAEIIPKWRLGLYGTGEVEGFLKKTVEMTSKEYRNTLFDFKNGNIVNYFSLTEGRKYWLVDYQRGSFIYLSVINKDTNKSRNYIHTDMTKKRSYIPFTIQSVSEDWLCTSISEQFYALLDENMREEFFSKVKSENDRVMLRNYDIENQNPIVCLFHLK